LRLVLDSNEYIGAYGENLEPRPARLLEYLVAHPRLHEVVVSRTIVEEVRRNLSEDRYKQFWIFLALLDVEIVEDWEIPHTLPTKYQAMGLKTGDASIASCAEAVQADVVITENRDFHGRSGLPFRPLRAEEFLKEQGASGQPAGG